MAEQTLSNPLVPTVCRLADRRQAVRENLLAYLFLLPALLAIVLVLFYPIISLLVTSFYSSPTLTRPSQLIDLKYNFSRKNVIIQSYQAVRKTTS